MAPYTQALVIQQVNDQNDLNEGLKFDQCCARLRLDSSEVVMFRRVRAPAFQPTGARGKENRKGRYPSP